jgi:hypothetical protein
MGPLTEVIALAIHAFRPVPARLPSLARPAAAGRS